MRFYKNVIYVLEGLTLAIAITCVMALLGHWLSIETRFMAGWFSGSAFWAWMSRRPILVKYDD